MSQAYEDLLYKLGTANTEFAALRRFSNDVFSNHPNLTAKPPQTRTFMFVRRSPGATKNQIDYQRAVIGNGLQMMRVANTLNVLLDRYSEVIGPEGAAWVRTNMENDMIAFSRYMRQANQIRARLHAPDLRRAFNSKTYEDDIGKLVRSDRQVGRREKTALGYNNTKPAQLLQRIFSSRIDAAEIAIRNVQAHSWFISMEASEAQGVKIRIETGQLARNGLTMGQILYSKVFCRDALAVVDGMLEKVNVFVDKLGQSDKDRPRSQNIFRVAAWDFYPLSIRELPNLPLAFNRELVP